MVEIFKISKTFLITFFIFLCCDILLYIVEIQSAVLPKFIASSYKENPEFQFNSILLNSMKKYIDTHFYDSSSLIPHLVGDLPIYDKTKNYVQSSFDIKEEEQKIINEIKLNKIYKAKIPVSKDSKYFLFPNSDKTKMYVIVFSLEKIKRTLEHENTDSYFFIKLSQVSLYEISINNFIINYQIEFDLKKAFFKQKWKIDIPGIITKYSFSNDYEQLILVYKNVINNNEIKYNFLYIDIKKGEYNDDFYDFIDMSGNLKINALAVKKNIIVYSRKYDIYKLSFLFKNSNNKKWINIRQEKMNPFLEPFNIITDLKFIVDNKNININNTYEKDAFLFIKGIKCNETGIQLYMNLLNINFSNLFNNKNISNKIISKNVPFLTEFLPPALFEGKNYDIFDENYTYNMDNLEISELNERLRDYREPIIFNKLLQKNNETSFLSCIFISSISTYFHILMNESYFYNITENDYNEDLFLIKAEEKTFKICGKDYYVIEYDDNKLSLGTNKSFNKTNKNKENENLSISLDIRRISFVDLPKFFKPNKILDYYFDNFNDKLILILLINEGELVSLDFSKLIKNKNNSGTFLLDNMNNKKLFMLFISCFFIFVYSVDWSYTDQLSINIRDWIFRLFNNQSYQNNNINDINQNRNIQNRFGNIMMYENGLSLSNSSLSILSFE